MALKRTKIVDIFDPALVGQQVCVKGWVRSRRGNKFVQFIALNDGSTINNLQIVVDLEKFSEEDMQHIADGVELDDGPIHADAVSYVSPTDRKQAGIEIHSGRNRIVRRIFESLGYHVVKLDRVYFAGLTKKNLPRGRWRYLTQEEDNFLKQNSFE